MTGILKVCPQVRVRVGYIFLLNMFVFLLAERQQNYKLVLYSVLFANFWYIHVLLLHMLVDFLFYEQLVPVSSPLFSIPFAIKLLKRKGREKEVTHNAVQRVM